MVTEGVGEVEHHWEPSNWRISPDNAALRGTMTVTLGVQQSSAHTEFMASG